MKTRPLSITILAWAFVAVCTVGLVYHLVPRPGAALDEAVREQGFVWVLGVRLLGVLGGLYVLGGYNWARWLLVVWLGYHVILSGLHSPLKMAVHGALFAVLLWVFFRGPASAYFRTNRQRQPGDVPGGL